MTPAALIVAGAPISLLLVRALGGGRYLGAGVIAQYGLRVGVQRTRVRVDSAIRRFLVESPQFAKAPAYF